jgi:hypothetical protein
MGNVEIDVISGMMVCPACNYEFTEMDIKKFTSPAPGMPPMSGAPKAPGMPKAPAAPGMSKAPELK